MEKARHRPGIGREIQVQVGSGKPAQAVNRLTGSTVPLVLARVHGASGVS
jgi:hypothetical protein